MADHITFVEILFVLFCTQGVVYTKAGAVLQTQTKQYRLHQALGLDDVGSGYRYNPAIRPTNSSNKTEPIVVKLWFRLQHIYDVQEKERSLQTNVDLIQKWQDKCLMWNPDDYDVIEYIIVRVDKIWTPDIIVENSLPATSARAKSYFGFGGETVKIDYDGTVTRKPSYILNTRCFFDITYFPLDNHMCMFFIRSVMYDTRQLTLETQKFAKLGDFNQILDDESEWKLLLMTSQQNAIDGDNGEKYSTAFVNMWIGRKPLFYTVNIIIPTMILIILTTVSYALPIESGDRVGVGLTVLLAFTVFNLVVAESVPKTSDGAPILTHYLTLAMFSNLQVVVWTIICYRYWIRPPRTPHKPRLFGRLILKLLRFTHVQDRSAICACATSVWTSRPKHNEEEAVEKETLLVDNSDTNTRGVDQNKSEDVAVTEIILCKWHLILEILDRLFFLLTLIIQIVAFFVMIVIMPWNEQHQINEFVANYDGQKGVIDYTKTYG